MMKILSTASLIAITIATSNPAQAAGIPVIDGANFSQALLDEIEQVGHGILNVKQLAQLSDQLQLGIKNGISLGSLGLDLRGALHDLIYSEEGEALFETLYGLNPDSPTYANDVVRLLREDYDLPTNNDELENKFRDNVEGDNADRAVRRAQRTRRDVETLTASHQVLADGRTKSYQYKEAIKEQYDDMAAVPDENLQLAVAENGRATLLTAKIAQTQLDMDILNNERALLQEQRRLEEEEEALQRQIKMLEHQKAIQTAPSSTIRKWNLK